jgi:hypothetical protein
VLAADRLGDKRRWVHSPASTGIVLIFYALGQKEAHRMGDSSQCSSDPRAAIAIGNEGRRPNIPREGWSEAFERAVKAPPAAPLLPGCLNEPWDDEE